MEKKSLYNPKKLDWRFKITAYNPESTEMAYVPVHVVHDGVQACVDGNDKAIEMTQVMLYAAWLKAVEAVG